MPKGNGIPKMPSQEEAARLELCVSMSELFEIATKEIDLKSSIALYKALGDEIDHCVAVFKREQRWHRLASLLIKPHNNEFLSDEELKEANELCRRQGLDPALLD